MTTPCILCAHTQTADQTCDPCVGRVRRTLIRIEQLYALLPYELAGRAGASLPMDPSGVRGDTDPMTGGDVMVMMGPGSPAQHASHRFVGKTVDDDGNRLCQCTDDGADVDSVLGTLERWDTDWRITFREPAATGPATVTGCVLYLLRRLTTAAQRHPAFHEFADDMRRLHDRLQVTLRMGPQWSEVPCYCGGRLERPMPLPDGRAFEWRCVRCHRNYTLEEFWLVTQQAGQAV